MIQTTVLLTKLYNKQKKDKFISDSVRIISSFIYLIKKLNIIFSIKIICAYLRALRMPKTLVLSYDAFEELFSSGQSKCLDAHKQLHMYTYIVGPHLLNRNHWLAVIIDLSKFRFMLIDPMKEMPLIFESTFKFWLCYYKSRNDYQPYAWNNEVVTDTRPFQTDGYNCGIFVINFIKNYCLNQTINFAHSEMHLFSDRLSIAHTIENFN